MLTEYKPTNKIELLFAVTTTLQDVLTMLRKCSATKLEKNDIMKIVEAKLHKNEAYALIKIKAKSRDSYCGNEYVIADLKKSTQNVLGNVNKKDATELDEILNYLLKEKNMSEALVVN